MIRPLPCLKSSFHWPLKWSGSSSQLADSKIRNLIDYLWYKIAHPLNLLLSGGYEIDTHCCFVYVRRKYFTEVFSLTNPSNFGIQTTFRFQIQVYYQVNRPLNDLLTLQGGSTAQWYSMKISLSCIFINWKRPFHQLCLINVTIWKQKHTIPMTTTFLPFSFIKWSI